MDKLSDTEIDPYGPVIASAATSIPDGSPLNGAESGLITAPIYALIYATSAYGTCATISRGIGANLLRVPPETGPVQQNAPNRQRPHGGAVS